MFTIESQDERARVTLAPREVEEGLTLVDISVDLVADEVPRPVTVSFCIPMVDVYSVWSPSIGADRALYPVWKPRVSVGRLGSYMPLHTLLSLSGENRLTVSLADAMIPTSITSGVVEEDATVLLSVTLFTDAVTPRASYTTTLRLDRRPMPYEDAIRLAAEWWRTDCGYTPAPVPDAARLPMNSLWYSYHQVLDPDAIVRECESSRPLGMDTVIIDDGWQTLDSSRGYDRCGDWEPVRLPDMRGLVDRIHALGMRVMLWFSVPFIGDRAKRFSEFRDCLIDRGGEGGIYLFDPRYPHVREYLVDTYRHAVQAWDLDGLKLDFIDSFKLHGDSYLPDARRDTESLEEGVDLLMSEVYRSLTEIKSDLMIEFRQAYVGPAIAKYGNIFRVTDCPNDTIFNHRATVDLRLTSGRTAVHSDMLMWHLEDTPESVAVQLLSTLFAVPQISVRTGELCDAHRRVLSRYLSLWRTNRELLLDGTFTAKHPESLYTQVKAERDGEAILLAYDEGIVDARGYHTFTACNASTERPLCLLLDRPMRYEICDCYGDVVECGEGNGTLLLPLVPMGATVVLRLVSN